MAKTGTRSNKERKMQRGKKGERIQIIDTLAILGKAWESQKQKIGTKSAKTISRMSRSC